MKATCFGCGFLVESSPRYCSNIGGPKTLPADGSRPSDCPVLSYNPPPHDIIRGRDGRVRTRTELVYLPQLHGDEASRPFSQRAVEGWAWRPYKPIAGLP